MKSLRLILPSLALAALAATGCFLISGQFLVTFDFPNTVSVTTGGVDGVTIDLNTISDYADHKDNLKGLADIAILGNFHNSGLTDIDVEVWMVDAGSVSLTTPGAVMTAGTRVWGPFHLAAGATENITWDKSAALFGAGKAALLTQIKGDGVFTLYALSQAGTYAFTITNGKLIAVIDAGT
jgi:hypothetical protein